LWELLPYPEFLLAPQIVPSVVSVPPNRKGADIEDRSIGIDIPFSISFVDVI
jgi:hypothetical protein